MYKIDIVKLVVVTVLLTVVVVVGLIFALDYLTKGRFLNINVFKESVGKRLTQGVVPTEKEEITPEKAVLQAINANRSRTVKIYRHLSLEDDLSVKEREFLGRGLIISKDGLVVTGKGGFQNDQEYSVVIPGQKEIVNLKPLAIEKEITVFRLPGEFRLIAELSSDLPKKDDLVVAIGGRERDGMATGRILKVEKVVDEQIIYTTIPTKSVEVGAPLINQEKEIIGMYISKSDSGKALFIATSDIKKIIQEVK
jgi:hypothetical protein